MKEVIVDTSIWIEYFKGNQAAAKIIHDQTNFEVHLAGPILTELIQGLKTEREKSAFSITMAGLPCIAISDQDWVNAGEIGFILRKKGVTVPLADLIIYTVALNNNCSIFTLDNHFEMINKAMGSNLELILL
jgi:predicted nucleic acid-binding protein